VSKAVVVKADEGYYFAKDVATILGFSERKAYDIIKSLNEELTEAGKVTYSGRVSKRYFHYRHDITIVEQDTKVGKAVKAVL
jgi:prophage antirepressor-like protein